MRRTAWLGLAAVGLAGCDQIDDFLPKVRFDGLEVRHIDWERADVDFVFRVDNPNPISIGMTSFSYNLGLETVPFLSGNNPDGFKLKAEGAAPLVLPLDLEYTTIWDAIQATRGEDIVNFNLDGRMGFDTPAGEVKLPYDQSGGFPALRTPRFSLKAARVPSFNLIRGVLDLELDVGVDNDLGTTLFFDGFDYGLSLNGRTVANGLVNTFEAPGATEQILTLPVELALLDIGSDLFDALVLGERLDLGLAAAVDVETPFGIVPLAIDEAGNLKVGK